VWRAKESGELIRGLEVGVHPPHIRAAVEKLVGVGVERLGDMGLGFRI
jgi:hypothetical protein